MRAYGRFGDGVSLAAGNRFNGLVVLPKIVFKQKTTVLFLEFLDNRQLISLKLLISRRVQVIESKLSERDIFRDKLHERKNCPFKVLNVQAQILYNGHSNIPFFGILGA